jgi:hypothetical protein
LATTSICWGTVKLCPRSVLVFIASGGVGIASTNEFAAVSVACDSDAKRCEAGSAATVVAANNAWRRGKVFDIEAAS